MDADSLAGRLSGLAGATCESRRGAVRGGLGGTRGVDELGDDSARLRRDAGKEATAVWRVSTEWQPLCILTRLVALEGDVSNFVLHERIVDSVAPAKFPR